jgi:hypothetical protein
MKYIFLLLLVASFNFSHAQSAYNSGKKLENVKYFGRWYKVYPDKPGEALLLKANTETLSLFLEEVIKVLDFYGVDIDTAQSLKYNMPPYATSLGNMDAIMRAFNEKGNSYTIQTLWPLNAHESVAISMNKTFFTVLIF